VNKRTFIAGLVSGILLAAPTTVLASRTIETPATKPIYDIGSTKDGDISVFDDAGNKCYVVNRYKGNHYEGDVAISCLRKE